MTTARDHEGRLLQDGRPVTASDLLWQANAEKPTIEPAPAVSFIDRCTLAAIDGFLNPRAPIPPLWVDVLVFIAGILIGAGVFQGG